MDTPSVKTGQQLYISKYNTGSGPALLHAAQDIIITTAVGTPLCWRTHAVIMCCPFQVSYGLIRGMG